jgi:hypothetical protein
MRYCWLAMSFAQLILGAGVSAAEDLDQPTHAEVEPIRFEIGPDGKIETMAMDHKGRLLCGVSWSTDQAAAADQPAEACLPQEEADTPPRRPAQRPLPGNLRRRPQAPPLENINDGTHEYAIKVLDGEGKVLATWPMKSIVPKMIHGCEDGTVYVGGPGKLGRFSPEGELLQMVETSTVIEGIYKNAHISGVTANEKYFFVAFGDGFSLRATEDIVRFNRDFSQPKLIVQQQFGCCSHLDLDTQGDLLLIAENSRHRVNRVSFEGDKQDTWGQRDRENLAGFAACCNPVNFDFGPNGVLYTAESGVGRIKKYSADGKYLGMVGYVDTTEFDRGSRLASMSCYIPVEVNHDASRIYVMDVRAQIIRVLARKPAKGDQP